MYWVALVSLLGAMPFLQTDGSYEAQLAEGVRLTEAQQWERALEAFRRASELQPSAPEPHLETARVHLLRSEPREALAAVDRGLSRAPGAVHALALRGTILMSMGLFDEAMLELATALERDAGHENARRQLALAAMRAGKPESTVQALRPLVAQGGAATSLDWALYGAALFQLGRTEEAVAPLQRSLEGNSEHPQALLYLGQSLLALGRAVEALDPFTRGARLPPPENVRFELGLVEAELALGRRDEARARVESLLQRHPRAGRGWFLAGLLAASEERHEDAARSFQSAIQHGHETALTHLNLGVARIATGDRAGARRSLDTARELDSGLAAVSYYQGLLAFEEGDAREAVSHLERAAALEPAEPRTYLALAEAYVKTRRFEEAQEAAAKAAASSDEMAARALYWKGLAHHEAIQYSDAEEAYRKAIELGLDDAEVHLNTSRALYAMAKHEEALAAVDDALERSPEQGDAHLLKGKIQIELRSYDSALHHLERACELLPGLADAWFRKGIAQSRLSRHEGAIEDWRRAIELDPDLLDAYYRLGSTLVREGSVEEGEALLTKFQERSSEAERQEHQIAKLKTTLRRARERAERGRDDEALAYFEEASRIAPLDPLPYLYLAEFRAQRGDMELAEATLLSGLEALPRHLSLHRALLSVYEAADWSDRADAARQRIAELEQVQPR